MSKTIAFIPIRKGSKSIINKNLKNFCGKPLVSWVITALNNSKLVDEIIIASDYDEIIPEIRLEKVHLYKRSFENAQDSSSTESVMFEYISKNNLNYEDTFILVQATSPFTKTIHFNEALEKFNRDSLDSLLSCVSFKRFLWTKDSKPINYDFKNRLKRQDFEGQFLENGAFYISKVKSILKFQNRLSGKIGIYEMPEYTGIEIDEEDDWLIAEKIMNKYSLNVNQDFPKIKYVFSDVDGVLTDSGMYYSEDGNEIKKFNTRDGYAFELLRDNGIKTGIITSEKTEIVSNRAKKLKIDYLFQGVKNKFKVISDFCYKNKIDLNSIAFIGDDVNDFELLSNLNVKACPSNAVDKIKSIPKINILSLKGGEGVFREFAENHILKLK
jgi:YrbI family 3-deoxy-D-manno-octulosonate 8-phosphate phosphatase